MRLPEALAEFFGEEVRESRHLAAGPGREIWLLFDFLLRASQLIAAEQLAYEQRLLFGILYGVPRAQP